MSTPTFTFPQPLAEKYRPRTIDNFAGLANVVGLIKRLTSVCSHHRYHEPLRPLSIHLRTGDVGNTGKDR